MSTIDERLDELKLVQTLLLRWEEDGTYGLDDFIADLKLVLTHPAVSEPAAPVDARDDDALLDLARQAAPAEGEKT